MFKQWVWRRRNYLIDREFQFRYLTRNLLAVAIMALIVMSTVYYTTWARIMDEFYNLPRVASRFAPLFSSVNQTLLLVLMIFLLLAAVASIFTSHSIAGPIYRFEKVLKSLAQGDLSFKVGLRRTDEFRRLADAFNELITRLRTSVSADADMVRELAVLLDRFNPRDGSLAKENVSPALAEDFKKMSQLLARLQENIGAFKLPEVR